MNEKKMTLEDIRKLLAEDYSETDTSVEGEDEMGDYTGEYDIEESDVATKLDEIADMSDELYAAIDEADSADEIPDWVKEKVDIAHANLSEVYSSYEDEENDQDSEEVNEEDKEKIPSAINYDECIKRFENLKKTIETKIKNTTTGDYMSRGNKAGDFIDDVIDPTIEVLKGGNEVKIQKTLKGFQLKADRYANYSNYGYNEVKDLMHYIKTSVLTENQMSDSEGEVVMASESVQLLGEEVDDSKFKQLVRLGLSDNESVSRIITIMKKIDSGKVLTSSEAMIVGDMFQTLIGIVTGDTSVFNKVKTAVSASA